MRRVLVIDDDPTVAKAISDLVNVAGGYGDVAITSEQAVEKIKNRDFDTVLIDFQLENRQTAVDVLRECGDCLTDKRVVVFTGHRDMPGLKEIDHIYKVEHVLFKPIHMPHVRLILADEMPERAVAYEPIR